MRYLLILASLFLIGPESTQTINRCPSMAANRVATSTEQIKLQTDADCFARAATIATTSAQVHTDRVAAIDGQRLIVCVDSGPIRNSDARMRR
ncbi:MAG: hypothetical protein EOO77_25625 [Oxalobacteraceae bacterium]|nr:MAG: hypothetical protein EOO77_25625 [Oxalobacteraceae bacterium]